MGLYGDILRAADGSIFTFDKIINLNSVINEEEKEENIREEIIDERINSLAENDNIFLGRFILLTEKLWVYVKTHDGEKYSYTKVAKLHSLNDISENNTDEWINVTNKNESGAFLYHEKAGPELKVLNPKQDVSPEEKYLTISPEDGYEAYKKAEGISIEALGLNFTYYDEKGHAFKVEPIRQNTKYYNGEDSYTLILNGGGFLNKILTE